MDDIGRFLTRRQCIPHPFLCDPWDHALAWSEEVAIALLIKTEGSNYRDVGSAMAVSASGKVAGNITSGCIEADIKLHAQEVLRTRKGRSLRYGKGSPYMDLSLPCGGAIELRIFLVKDKPVLNRLAACRKERKPVRLVLDMEDRLHLESSDEQIEVCSVSFGREISFAIFGTGAEPAIFSNLVSGLGYQCQLYSHQCATIDAAIEMGVAAVELRSMRDVRCFDEDTAIVLFYHDHEYEYPVLAKAFASSAFYIGAQGSQNTHRLRCDRLRAIGLPEEAIQRIHGPMGILKRRRDPKSLAISVLAEILSKADKT